jgi:hypothetical protein
VTRHRHPHPRHKRILPQLHEGSQILGEAHLSARDLAAVWDAGFEAAVHNSVAREQRWRAARDANAALGLPPVSTARSRHFARRRERRRLQREEEEQQTRTD